MDESNEGVILIIQFMTSSYLAIGYRKVDDSMAGICFRIFRWKRVITAGKPGPAPLDAHKRSEFSLASTWMASPFAVTTSRAKIFSQAHPQFYRICQRSGKSSLVATTLTLQFQPMPPCNRKPPSPTSGQCPPQNMRPSADKASLSI